MVFKSKQDWWLIAIIYASGALCLSTSAYLLYMQMSAENILMSIIIFFAGCAFPIWLVRSLKYVIEQEHLYIFCGVFKWTIPLSDIKHIEPSSNAISSPALSLDRLLINYGHNQSILISPLDKAGFIKAISERKS